MSGPRKRQSATASLASSPSSRGTLQPSRPSDGTVQAVSNDSTSAEQGQPSRRFSPHSRLFELSSKVRHPQAGMDGSGLTQVKSKSQARAPCWGPELRGTQHCAPTSTAPSAGQHDAHVSISSALLKQSQPAKATTQPTSMGLAPPSSKASQRPQPQKGCQKAAQSQAPKGLGSIEPNAATEKPQSTPQLPHSAAKISQPTCLQSPFLEQLAHGSQSDPELLQKPSEASESGQADNAEEKEESRENDQSQKQSEDTQSQQPSTAPGATGQPQHNEPADTVARNGSKVSKDREPKKRQSVYFTNEQWDALHRRKGGLSITAGRLPVTHPGRPWMHHISAHLHFSTWEVQKLFIDARQAGNAGRYEECKKKLIEAHRVELWNTRITVDLAEIEFALQRFLDADAWASLTVGLDSKNISAYHWRAKARRAYNFLVGARDDLRHAIVHTVIPDQHDALNKELQELRLLAAKTPKDVQQRAAERSCQYNERIATELHLAKDARAKYLNMKKMKREDFLRRKERFEQQRAREREQMERMEKKEHVNERSNGEPYYVQCDNNVFIRIDPPKGTSSMSSTEGTKGKTWNKEAVPQSELARELTQRQAKSRGCSIQAEIGEHDMFLKTATGALESFGAGRSSSVSGSGPVRYPCLEIADAVHNGLGLSPQYEHLLQHESIEFINCDDNDEVLSLLENLRVKQDIRELQQKVEEAQASSKADSQTTETQKTEAQKTSGNNKKKKSKKKGSKAVGIEQVTARGIMEGPPAPAGPPTALTSLPDSQSSSNGPAVHAEPTRGAELQDRLYTADIEHRLFNHIKWQQREEVQPKGEPDGTEEPEQAQADPAAEPEIVSESGVSATDAEQIDRLHISIPADSEEELFHDAGSGPDSAAQQASLGSRRASMDSDLAWPLYSSAGTDNGIKTLDEESEQHFQEALDEELSPSGSKDLQGVEADDVPLQAAGCDHNANLSKEADSAPLRPAGNADQQSMASKAVPLQPAGKEDQRWMEAENEHVRPAGIICKKPDDTLLRNIVEAAKDAIKKHDFKAAVGHCRGAIDLDLFCLPAYLLKAEACLRLGRYKICAATYGLIMKQFPEWSAKDRHQHFNQAAQAAEALLNEGGAASLVHLQSLLEALRELQNRPDHEARVVFLESCMRLRTDRLGSPSIHPERFKFSLRDTSADEMAKLSEEAERLLKVDGTVIEAMAMSYQPSILTYRKLMTEVAKEAGNARTKQEKYKAALGMYCLAIRLDPDNLSALNNRALVHLMVNDPESAIRDTTAVIEAVENGAVSEKKKQRELLERATYRRGKAFYDLGNKIGNPVDYLNAHEDLSALNKPNDEAIKIVGLCHAIILQNGGAQELALRSSFVSKTAAAPPSEEDLAAMGEDGSGLSLSEMMKRFSGPSNSDMSSPRKDVQDSVGGSSEQTTEGSTVCNPYEEETDTESGKAGQQQQDGHFKPIARSWRDVWPFKSNLSYTKKERASSFCFDIPNLEKPAKSSKKQSDAKELFGKKGFVFKFPIADSTAAASVAASNAKAASSSAIISTYSRAAARGEKDKPRRERSSIQLPPYEASLVKEAARGIRLMSITHEWMQSGAQGLPHLYLHTCEEIQAFVDFIKLRSSTEAEAAVKRNAIQSSIDKVKRWISQQQSLGRFKEAAQILAQQTGRAEEYMIAARHCSTAEMFSDAEACAEAVVAADKSHVEALSMLTSIQTKKASFGPLDTGTLRMTPGWKPSNAGLTTIPSNAAKQKGKKKRNSRK